MRKFQKGDKIIAITTTQYWKKGNTGTIVAYSADIHDATVQFDKPHFYGDGRWYVDTHKDVTHFVPSVSNSLQAAIDKAVDELQ